MRIRVRAARNCGAGNSEKEEKFYRPQTSDYPRRSVSRAKETDPEGRDRDALLIQLAPNRRFRAESAGTRKSHIMQKSSRGAERGLHADPRYPITGGQRKASNSFKFMNHPQIGGLYYIR